jgi:MSHA pilin protein MshD
MTLIELVIAIVIIGVGLAGVLTVFSTTVKGSADPVIHKQMLSVADEMMEEITLKPYNDPLGVAYAAPVGCVRIAFDDIADYHGYSTANVCDIGGIFIPSLAGYSVSVTVVTDAATLPGVTAAKKISVTVTHGTESTSLVSWRTDYGP